MQQRVRAAESLELPDAVGHLVAEIAQPGEQAVAQRALGRRDRDPRRDDAAEHGDGVAHIRREERGAEVAAVVPAFGQEGMPGGAGVELGDEVHDRRRVGAIGTGRVECAVPQILIDVPDRLAGVVRSGGEEAGATVAQPHCREPAARHELVASRQPRVEPLEHEGARLAIGSGAQAPDTGLQPGDLDGAGACAAAEKGPLEGAAQVARPRLAGVDNAAK